ncbi:hypothetical protein VNI00_010270 [Paramarasmius palmivorus]|uniref:Uncharacterized protein n=1 Tax=Paramarasmius palmivorus TaxID=297713 RepID=A0AAW0CJL3_9AGAR
MVDSDALQAAKLHILAALIECMFYGGFVVLMVITLVSTFRKTITSQILRIHLIGLIMLCLASIHVVSNVTGIVRGLGSGGGILDQFDNPISLLQQATLVLQIILGDGSWLYRLHIVWAGNKRVTYPFTLLVISAAGLGVRSIVIFGKISTDIRTRIPPEIRNAGIAVVAVALVSSIGFTVLIAFRVCTVQWRVRKQLYSSGKGRARTTLKDFITLVIESGAIYTTFLLLFLISLVYDSPVSTVPNEVIIQIVSTLPRENHHFQRETRNRIMQHGTYVELSSPIMAPPPVAIHAQK